jgi:mitogen-activated protein kinase kinase kinase
VHPARNAIAEVKEKEKFNKQENRKSIRYIAQDWKRKTLMRNKDSKASAADANKEKDAKLEEPKPDRRKSTSMWGHKLVEVTPGKLSSVPSTIPESPASASEDKPGERNK